MVKPAAKLYNPVVHCTLVTRIFHGWHCRCRVQHKDPTTRTMGKSGPLMTVSNNNNQLDLRHTHGSSSTSSLHNTVAGSGVRYLGYTHTRANADTITKTESVNAKASSESVMLLFMGHKTYPKTVVKCQPALFSVLMLLLLVCFPSQLPSPPSPPLLFLFPV